MGTDRPGEVPVLLIYLGTFGSRHGKYCLPHGVSCVFPYCWRVLRQVMVRVYGWDKVINRLSVAALVVEAQPEEYTSPDSAANIKFASCRSSPSLPTRRKT